MASHPPPFHRSRQSTKALDPTGQTAQFLYTILKQLDLKSVDWNKVAADQNITNGHAARMRWSRFRAQIEGLDNSYSRYGGKKRNDEKKRKKQRKEGLNARPEDDDEQDRKPDKRPNTNDMRNTQNEGMYNGVSQNSYAFPGTVQNELAKRFRTIDGVNIHHPTISSIPLPDQTAKSTEIMRQPVNVNQYAYQPMQPNDTMSNAQTNSRVNWTSNSLGSPWVQQSSHNAYAAPYQSSYHKPMYHPSAIYYTPQPQYSTSYAGQFQPQRNFGTQLQPTKFPESQNYGYDSFAAIPDDFGGLAPLPSLDRTIFQDEDLGLPSALTAIDSQVESQGLVKAQEAAAEASYPWPYSEADVPKIEESATDLGTKTNIAAGGGSNVKDEFAMPALFGLTNGMETMHAPLKSVSPVEEKRFQSVKTANDIVASPFDNNTTKDEGHEMSSFIKAEPVV